MSGPVDHCAEAERLRGIRTALAAGDGIASVRNADEEVRYFKGDAAALDRLIDFHERECALANGEAPKRRRFAKQTHFRPS